MLPPIASVPSATPHPTTQRWSPPSRLLDEDRPAFHDSRKHAGLTSSIALRAATLLPIGPCEVLAPSVVNDRRRTDSGDVRHS